jgi:hypothetical protein
LPEHLDEDSSPKLAEWNKARKKLEESISTSNKALTTILNDILNDISVSKDKISKELSILYSKSKKPTPVDIEKARFRKEIGNPPGKKEDPLGDQLSWEQLLNIIPKITTLWVVSTDRDYFNEHKKSLYLNPILYNDLIKLNPKLEVKIFNTLSKALKDFDSIEKINTIPSKEELDIISVNESKDLTDLTSSSASFTKIYNFLQNKPTLCLKCGEPNSMLDGVNLRSQYGGLTLQYICKKCGFHNDTGDSFDYAD